MFSLGDTSLVHANSRSRHLYASLPEVASAHIPMGRGAVRVLSEYCPSAEPSAERGAAAELYARRSHLSASNLNAQADGCSTKVDTHRFTVLRTRSQLHALLRRRYLEALERSGSARRDSRVHPRGRSLYGIRYEPPRAPRP